MIAPFHLGSLESSLHLRNTRKVLLDPQVALSDNAEQNHEGADASKPAAELKGCTSALMTLRREHLKQDRLRKHPPLPERLVEPRWPQQHLLEPVAHLL
jgi:hypothetical protein